MKKLRILATGGAGYVGSACVRALVERGHECFAFDNLSTGFRAAVPAERLIEGDLANRELLIKILREKEINAVMHFAGCIAVGESVTNPRLYYRNNIANSLNLLEAMQEAEVGKILFSSTAAVYAPSDNLLAEDFRKEPASPYAFSKFVTERLIQDFSSAYSLGCTILRYFNASGGSFDGGHGEAHNPETHLIPLVLQVPLDHRDYISVFGDDYESPDGTCIRDYIHIEDLAEAHIKAIEAIDGEGGTIYNVGTGKGYSVLEVIKTAEEVVGKKIKIKISDRRAGDTTRLVADAEKIRERLGWKPKYENLRDIIATAWLWHKNHPGGYKWMSG